MPRPETLERHGETLERTGATLRFDAIGTTWSIQTDRPLPDDVERAVASRIARFDRTWSRFRDDSLVAEMSRRAGRFELPAEAGALLDLYARLGRATGGLVNPLVGRRLEHLGYDSSYSFRPTADPAGVPAWGDTATWDGRSLTTTEPVLLDVGAAGKGYLVDLVAAILTDAGLTDHVVDAGGDLRHRGSPAAAPARVALEHPLDPTLAIGVLELRDGALAASAPNRRAWGDGIHHILDGATGRPTRDVLATWALAPTALEADGLATALFFAGADALRQAGVGIDFEALRILATGEVEATPVFEAVLFR